MALRALPLAGARLELPFVRIDGVAVDALGEGHFLLEVSLCVAVGAGNFQVHSQQRVLCFRMVELHRGIDFFPTGGGVAGFAGSLKSSLVRIRVAVGAGFELDSLELYGLVGAGREMALFAGHLRMHSGQRILGLGVVELLGLLPVGQVVATLAIGTELSLVDVLMAGDAILRQAHK